MKCSYPWIYFIQFKFALWVHIPFSDFEVLAHGEVHITQNVTTVGGELNFNWTHGSMFISTEAEVVAVGGDLVLDSADSHIFIDLPSVVASKTHSFHIYRDMTVTRHPNKNCNGS